MRRPPSGPSLRVFLALPALGLALLLGGCGGGGGSGTTTAAASEASLATLGVSAGALAPAFDAGTTSYAVVVGESSTSVTLTPMPADAGATVTVDGTPVAGGSASGPIALPAGATAVDVTVTAADGATTQTYTVTITRLVSLDLVDPTPGAGDKFGQQVVVLANGNIVVTDGLDSSVAPFAGAVHLYAPTSGTPIASIYGDDENDFFGFAGPTALPNGNFVVASRDDDVGGIEDAGSVRLYDGATGAPLGTPLVGDADDDRMGQGGVVVLPSGNYLALSPSDSPGGVRDAGSVQLVDGATGALIGAAIAEADVSEGLAASASNYAVLAGGNFVLASSRRDVGGLVDTGWVQLFDGATAAPIGTALSGDEARDSLGIGGLTPLASGHVVISSYRDDEGGITDAGSVRLMDGSTGAQIGTALVGDVAGDLLGATGIVPLANGNFVVLTQDDNEGGISRAGSVRLVDGLTGAQIGATLAGDDADDRLGSDGAAALTNGNVAVASRYDDVGGIVDAGSVYLLDGTTGAPIGPAHAGDTISDRLGDRGLTALTNGNFVIASESDDVGGIVDAGSVRLIDGTTGAQIGAPLAGDVAQDRIGHSAIVALPNGNVAVASDSDDEGGIVNAGSVRVLDGATGAQVGPTLAGDADGDSLGLNPLTALANATFTTISRLDDVGGVVNAGSLYLVDGASGLPLLAPLTGATANDLRDARIAGSPDGTYVVVGLPSWDDGAVDTGRVRLLAP